MTSRLRRWATAAAVALATSVTLGAGGQQSGGQQNLERPALPNPYRTVYDIVTMPEGRTMGSTNAINVDARGNIWVFERCGANSCAESTVDPILQFDPSGKFIRSFGAGKFVFPHGIEFDAEGNLWIVDAGVVDNVKGSQIFKYSPDGRVLLTLGRAGVRGTNASQDLFNEPSDIAIAPNGDLYVADGHINTQSNRRIVHLTKDGRFIEAFGMPGTGPGQFDNPHSLAIDSAGRIFVGDRTNNRLQILSPRGEFIAEWRQFGRPSGVRIHNDILYVADSESRNVPGQYGYNPGFHRGIYIGSVKDGIVTTFIPDPAPKGGASFPEGITVDTSGVIWGASIGDRNVMKFVPPTPPPADACSTPPPLPAGEKPAQSIFAAGTYPIALPAVAPTGVRNDLPNPYRDGVAWGQLPAGRLWGSTASVSIAPDGTVWAIDRCGIATVGGVSCDGPGKGVAPIFQFDTSGKLLKNIGADIFTGPHKMSVDADGNLWVADNAGAQVFKLNQEGQVLLTLGKKNQRGTTDGLFDTPTDVAVAANGDVFIADGHDGGGSATGVARIVKLDKSGKFLKSWGRKGMGPGEFDVVHAIAIDSRGRVFAADRQNNRIQIFDAEGTFIAQWGQFGRPSGLYINRRDDTLYVSDSESRDARTNTGRNALAAATGYGYNLGVRRGVRIGSARDGSVKSFIPDPCPYPYAFLSTMGEGVTADRDGNVYTAEPFARRLLKFVKSRP